MRIQIKKAVLACFALAVLIYIFTTEFDWDFSRSSWALPLSGKVIMIDPGHGGVDGGAKSKSGVIEKEVTLAISIYLRDFLQQSGALVYMTRETDRELSSEESHRLGKRKEEDLLNRVKFINESNADLYISIHLNSIPSPRWRGAQTFYYPQSKESQSIALLIQEELVRNLENTTRKAKKNQDLFILRQSKVPGALVEVGFLSNPEESALLETADYQKKVAASIYQGILRYYTGEEKQSTYERKITN